MPARLPVLVRGRARRSCRPAAATRRAPPRTLPHQGSLTHPVSCWHGLAPRLPSTRFIPTPLCTCPAPTPPPPRPQKVNHRTRRSRNDLRYAPLYTWANLRPLRAQLRTLLQSRGGGRRRLLVRVKVRVRVRLRVRVRVRVRVRDGRRVRSKVRDRQPPSDQPPPTHHRPRARTMAAPPPPTFLHGCTQRRLLR